MSLYMILAEGLLKYTNNNNIYMNMFFKSKVTHSSLGWASSKEMSSFILSAGGLIPYNNIMIK